MTALNLNHLTAVLSNEEVTSLRSGYDRSVMNALVERSISGIHPPAAPWMGFIMSELYGPDAALDPRDREILVIGLLAGRREFGTLAVHLYWGLMEGLSPAELAQVLTISGTYTGVSNFVQGTRVAHRTLGLLKEHAVTDTSVPAVLARLVQLFPA